MKIWKYVLVLLMALAGTTGLTDAQWQRTGGPGGGTVYSLTVCGTNILAGTLASGIFRSQDDGANWSAVNNGIPANTCVTALASNGTKIYACTSQGLYASADSGQTWDTLNTVIKCLSSVVESGNNLFVGSSSYGVFLSQDSGVTWTPANNGLNNLHVKSLAVKSNSLFAGTFQGIFVSADNGTTWTPAGLQGSAVLSIVVTETCIFAGTCYGGGGIFRSTDNGLNWTEVSDGLTNKNVLSMAICGADILAGTFGGIFISYDNAANWSVAGTGLPDTYTNALTANGNSIFAGNNYYGVYRKAVNSGVWTPVNNGLAGTTTDLLISAGTKLFATSDRDQVSVSENGGRNWTSLGATGSSINSLTANGSRLFAGTDAGVFEFTSNGGDSLNSGLGNLHVYKLILKTSELIAGTAGGVFTMNLAGTSWTSLGLQASVVSAMMADGPNLYAGTSFDGIFLSTDHGATWSYLGCPGIQYINSLALSGTSLFAGTYDWDGLYVSYDKGLNWAHDTLLGVSDFWPFTVSGPYFLAGSDEGVFISTDNGATWIHWDDGMEGIPVLSLASIGDTVFAGTAGNGIWKRSVNETLGISETGPCDGRTFVYPNPTTGRLTIEMPGASSVNIFNLQGELIKTTGLVNGMAILDISHFEKGIYLVEVIKARKVVVFKIIRQ